MVTVFLTDSGKEIDVIATSVTYVKQVGDIGDVSKVNTSYSWGLRYPKTPRNVETFKGLGLVGDTSDSPYIKIRVNLVDDGISIVSNGLLLLKETTTEYKGNIQDGIVDFFKDVSVDKISDVIDLSDLTHLNTVQNIIASFSNPVYRYIIANFNGPPLANVNGVTNLNPFALVPSINIRFLFDAIMDFYGWTYSGDIDLEGLWMTYPNAIGFTIDESAPPVMVGSAALKEYPGPNANFVGGPRVLYEFTDVAINTDFIYEVDTGHPNPTSFAFAQPGNYRISFAVEGFSRVYQAVPFFATDVRVYLYRNGTPVLTPVEIYTTLNGSEDNEDTPEDEATTGEEVIVFDIVAFENEVIQLATELEFIGDFNQDVTVTKGSMRIDQLGVQNVDFNEALIKVKVSDFFKEILTRQALTPFPDVDHRNIHFINIDNRINAGIIDWSDKYVRRTKERYVYDSYARNNNFTHKYDSNDQDFNDGVLVVDNENLPEEKTLYKSFTHSPLEEFVTYNGSNNSEYQVNNFKMFNAEVTRDPETEETLAEYKPIRNRFYIFKSEIRVDSIFILGNPVNSFPVAILGGNTFKDVVNSRYGQINKILNDTRIHTLELALTKWEVATLDLSSRYYFAQEATVYMINKLTWKNRRTCTGEFVRVVELGTSEDTGNNLTSFLCSTTLQPSHDLACPLPSLQTRLFSGEESEPREGDTIFTNSEGAILIGNDNYLKTAEGYTLRVSSAGIVTLRTQCTP